MAKRDTVTEGTNGSPEVDRNQRKHQIDKQATGMVFKVEYEQMEPADKLDYLRVQITESEATLRERTDAAL